MKQLTLNLTFAVAPAVKSIFKNTTWLNAGWATALSGFHQKGGDQPIVERCLDAHPCR